MIALEVDLPAGRHQRGGVYRLVKLQICRPGQHHFIECPPADSLCRPGNQLKPAGPVREMRFAHHRLRDRGDRLALRQSLHKLPRALGLRFQGGVAPEHQAQRCGPAEALPQKARQEQIALLWIEGINAHHSQVGCVRITV